MNQITLTFSFDKTTLASDIERAHATIDAVAGNFIAATLQSNGSTPALPASGPQPTTDIESVAAAQGNVELDAAGLPWDGRIHASTKNKTQKGEWTKLKGVADAVRDAVTAELRQRYPEPTAAAVASIPAAANGATVVPNVGAVIPAVGVSVPQISIAPKSEYQKLVDYIAQAIGSGKLTQETVDATFQQNNTSLAALAGNEEHSTAYREAFEGYVAQQG